MRVLRHEPDNDDPWGWFVIILATCLAAVLVFLTEEPPLRGYTDGQQIGNSDNPGPIPDHSAVAAAQ
jgi:hypothetical protein